MYERAALQAAQGYVSIAVANHKEDAMLRDELHDNRIAKLKGEIRRIWDEGGLNAPPGSETRIAAEQRIARVNRELESLGANPGAG